jgi:hypothetical protein
MSSVLAAIEEASADATIERVNRELSELMLATEATNRAMEEAVEGARQENERQAERLRARREAFDS